MISTKPRSGVPNATIERRMRLSTQFMGFAYTDGTLALVKIQHNGKRYGRLARRNHDHKDGGNLSIQIDRAISGECHEINVRGIQDKLDSHQNCDCIAP